VFSAEQLCHDSQEEDYSPESVSVLVSRIRQKFAARGAPSVVETVRGFGYRLHPSAAPDDEDLLNAGTRRDLRDALWQLQEAVIEVEHAGGLEQQRSAVETLAAARRAVFATLSE
jgi:hypothetical protein